VTYVYDDVTYVYDDVTHLPVLRSAAMGRRQRVQSKEPRVYKRRRLRRRQRQQSVCRQHMSRHHTHMSHHQRKEPRVYKRRRLRRRQRQQSVFIRDI